jgi:hypothetical protein
MPIVSRIALVAERGKAATNSVNRMSMEGILKGVLINELGSMEGTSDVVIMGETSMLTFT